MLIGSEKVTHAMRTINRKIAAAANTVQIILSVTVSTHHEVPKIKTETIKVTIKLLEMT